MGYGPAIFSGLLSGLSGLPQGMQAATNEDLSRQRLGMEQQQIDLQKQAMQGVEVPATAVPSGWGTPSPTGGGVMLRPQVLPFLQHFQGQQQETSDRATAVAALRRIATQTGNQNFQHIADLMEGKAIKDAGTLYETEIKGQQTIDEANRNAAMINAAMSGQPIQFPDMARRGSAPTPIETPTVIGGGMPQAQVPPINPSLPPAQQPTVQNAGRDLATALKNLATTPSGLPGVTPPAPGGGSGGPLTPMPQTPSALRPDLSLKLGPLTLGLKTPNDERDAYASAMNRGLLFHQLPPDRQVAVLAQMRQDKIDTAAAQGQNAANIPARTPEMQIKDFSAIDLAQGQLNEMLRLAPKVNLPQIAGGLAPWVNSIAQTGKVGPIPIPPEVSGTLSAEQNRFLAMLQDYADQVLRLRSGAQINEQEFKRMLGFLASPDVRPDVLMQRLRLQQDFLRAKREGLGATLQGAGYRVPPPMAPSFTPPPGAPPPVEVPNTTPAPQPGILQRVLPGIFGGPQAPATPQTAPQGTPAQGKVRVRAPDGRPGTWDLSRGPIPPGYTRIP